MVAILILRNCISRFGARPHAVQRPVRAAIVALAAAIALTMSPPASAGITAIDASSDPLKAAEAYHAYLADYAPGMIEPIVDYSTIASQPAKCDRNLKPKVHAILIGVSEAGAPFNKLDGPDNDVDLIGSSLSSRGVADDDIYVLVGDDAGREMVGNADQEPQYRPIERAGHEGGDMVFVRQAQ
jgi:hypothetical protein